MYGAMGGRGPKSSLYPIEILNLLIEMEEIVLKKGVVCVMLIFAMIISLLPSVSIFALADGNEEVSGKTGMANWMYEAGTLTIYGTGSMADYDTPDHLPWIDLAGQIETVIIESGVTNIGKWAFGRCSCMNRIIIPKSVTTIGEASFAGCSGLTSVSIPEGITSIGDLAFLMCSSLTEVKLSNTIISIGDRAFYELTDLTSVLYQGTLTTWQQITIGYNNDPLNKVQYESYDGNPESISNGSNQNVIVASGTCGATEDGSNLIWKLDTQGTLTISGSGRMQDYTNADDNRPPWYNNREKIINLVLEEGITNIGSHSFYECKSLISAEIPFGVTSIESHSFGGCTNLVSLSIPESVTIIGVDSFRACYSLPSLTFPESLLEIRGLAFSGCESLTSVAIPKNVTYIGNGAFSHCNKLTAINVDSGNISYTAENGVLFDKSRETLIQYPGGKSEDYQVPQGVKKISFCAFYGCNGLKSVTIPDSVTTIDNWAFSYCSCLTTVTISNSVVSIGDNVFYISDNISNVYYSGTQAQWAAISIGSNNNSLTSIEIHYNSAVLVNDYYVFNSHTPVYNFFSVDDRAKTHSSTAFIMTAEFFPLSANFAKRDKNTCS